MKGIFDVILTIIAVIAIYSELRSYKLTQEILYEAIRFIFGSSRIFLWIALIGLILLIPPIQSILEVINILLIVFWAILWCKNMPERFRNNQYVKWIKSLLGKK